MKTETSFKIYQIPAFTDNYIYIIHETLEKKTFVIDPGEFEPVQDFLNKHNFKLDAILSTHHHFDHTGANLKLKKIWSCPVYGFKKDAHRIPGLDYSLQEGESVIIASLKFEVIYVPGHTLGHIVFWNKEHKILFCGDVLFAMGCGRLFEGTAKQMYTSLNKIKELPLQTLIYCAHEYTLKNIKFALSLEPQNPHLKSRYKQVVNLRAENKSTVPFFLKEELLTNPFLKAKSLTEFSRLRQQRDSF